MKEIDQYFGLPLKTAGERIGLAGIILFTLVLIPLLCSMVIITEDELALVLLGILASIFFIYALTSLALFFGAKQDNDKLLLPWLIWQGVLMSLGFVGCTVSFIVALYFLLWLVCLTILTGGSGFFIPQFKVWWTIYCLRRKIRREKCGGSCINILEACN